MKLLICVINHDDTYSLSEALVRQDYDATMISTTGGFLREGNATLLVGVADEKVRHVLQIIRANCRTRTKYVHPFPFTMDGEDTLIVDPIEVEVGGAVVFIMDVERFERF